jgi:hypothetical protein
MTIIPALKIFAILALFVSKKKAATTWKLSVNFLTTWTNHTNVMFLLAVLQRVVAMQS